MNTSEIITFIGGDFRMLSCAKELSALGYKVNLFGYENYNKELKDITFSNNLQNCINTSDILVLPLPYSRDKNKICAAYSNKDITLDDIRQCDLSNKVILGGCFDSKFEEKLIDKNCKIIDYYLREELKVLNAIPTAEGALAIAIIETNITIHSSKCAVLSFGCVGRAIARVLHLIGAEVTVIARSASALSKAASLGYKTEHINNIKNALMNKDFIFNAIPEIIITKEILDCIDKKTLIIDLASKPGGVDVNASENLGIRTIYAPSLPNKYAPITAGEYLAKTINHILKGVE